MTSSFCSIVLQAPASSLRFHISTNAAKFLYSNCISSSGSQKRYVSSYLKNSRRSLTLRTAAMCCDIFFWSQNVNMRLFLPTQSKVPENSSKFGQRLHTSAGLFIGFLVCCSASQPVHAEASGESRGNSSTTGYSHGKEVYTDYSVIGIPGDGRCLFRSVAHGACVRSGNPPLDENLQRQLADELRARVADEFIKRREETEWFIEGDFNTYVAQMRNCHVWGGEPELLMASHVLQMPISVYMYDQDANGLISIAVGTPPPPAADTAMISADVPSAEAPTSRRRGGGQKRKANAIGSSASSTPPSTLSKRQVREKQSAVPFPPIHNGPLTRARQQPNNAAAAAAIAAAAASPSGFGVRIESEVLRTAEASVEEAVKVDKESKQVKEDLEALEAEIEAEIESIRSRDRNVHVVPTHAGWFSWTEVHPLEKRTMPSFFNEKLENRTPEIYMEIRNWIMKKYHTDPNIQIELNDLSELSAGDLDMKREVLEFLDYWGLINYHPFPQTNSAVNVDIDRDEAAKTDSLVDKLFRFESEETWTPVLPRSSVATPSASSGFFPESAIAEELMKSEEPAVEYHCNSCSADCSRKRYHCQKEADFDLCSECFNNAKFGSGMSPSDFIVMEPGEAGGASGGKWTDQETLLLLEALELYKENWNEIAEHVATKTKAQCILHFIQMPIEDTFLDTDSESNKCVEEKEDAVLSKDDTSASIDTPEITESKDDGNDNQLSSTVETSKPENVNGPTPQEEVGENCALNALRDAFTAVDFYPPPGERASFAEAGNPVMAVAAFLVKLVEAKRVTASVRSSFKSISGNPSGEKLALRHCFVLEDPLDDGKTSSDSDRPANGSVDPEDKKDEDDNVEMQKEEKLTSVIDEKSSSTGQEETKGETNIDKKCEEQDGKNHEEKNEKVLEEATHLVSTSDENAEKSDTLKQSGPVPVDKAGEPASLKEPDDAGLSVGQTPSTTAESDVLMSKLELPPGFEKESVDEAVMAVPSESPDTPKDEDMMPAVQIKEPEQSMKSSSVLENGENTGAGEVKDSVDGEKNPLKTKSDLDIDKIKRAAVTALSAAAVKAKYLADQEEDQIRLLTISLIEKQLHKLESKIAFFHDMDNVVMRVRELLERSKQRLLIERSQILKARYPAHPATQSVPANRPGMTLANSAPRLPTAMNSQRIPNSRPLMAGTPTPSSFMPTTVSGNSMQPSK